MSTLWNVTSLIKAAHEIRDRAHTPYSNFAVGAALATRSGKVFSGCNVENVSFRVTICAEEAAVAAAVAGGEKDFVAIALVTDSREPAMPCGACRQVLAEFNPDLEVISCTVSGRKATLRLSELLPRANQGVLESLRNV
jgi:cytidine deaminase